MFVFIALALPSSGGAIPLQAVPGFFRFLAVFEPFFGFAMTRYYERKDFPGDVRQAGEDVGLTTSPQ
jgi:hypothetical protein